MGLEQVKIRASDIQLGMYVSQLDRPWSSTSYPLQGFLLREPKDIETLRFYCDYVFIDITKGRNAAEARAPVSSFNNAVETPVKKISAAHTRLEAEKGAGCYDAKTITVNRHVYVSDVVPLRVEAKQAERALKTLRGHLVLASKQLAKGRDFDYDGLRKSVDQMVDSVVRCPDAFTWLMKLRIKDRFSHDHSLRSALWAAQFARYVGLSKDEISVLTLGCLLKDIGKIKLPGALVKAAKRTPEQETEYQTFIELGVEVLRSRQVDSRVIAVIQHHCERNDGSGFPQGLRGGKTPLLSRIAGIAACYDQLSTPRPGKSGLSPSRAISTLYNMRGREFQDDLVVQFIQSVGLYPTGTLVEMTTGDVGVVVEQNPKSRLTPQLAIIPPQTSANDACGYFLIDLKEPEKARKELTKRGFKRAANVPKMAIARDLELSGHQVDLEAVSQLFMQQAANQLAGAIGPAAAGSFFSRIKRKLARF